MVHLGNHPEVALCVRCAHFVHKQAWKIEDGTRAGALAGARDAFRRVRREVVRRGWQHSSLFGPALRWLGKHLPWHPLGAQARGSQSVSWWWVSCWSASAASNSSSAAWISGFSITG
jgi:hypothetical protein